LTLSLRIREGFVSSLPRNATPRRPVAEAAGARRSPEKYYEKITAVTGPWRK
jgi:hypothetical protein